MGEIRRFTIDVDTSTIRAVYCFSCDEKVAEYKGGMISRTIVNLNVDSHKNHPTTGITRDVKHEIATLDIRTKEVFNGVVLDPEYLQ